MSAIRLVKTEHVRSSIALERNQNDHGSLLNHRRGSAHLDCLPCEAESGGLGMALLTLLVVVLFSFGMGVWIGRVSAGPR